MTTMIKNKDISTTVDKFNLRQNHSSMIILASLCSEGVKYITRKTESDHISKHHEESWKYNERQGISKELWDVW